MGDGPLWWATAPVGGGRGPDEQHRAGRVAAHRALERAGRADPTSADLIGRRADGAPVFPAGTVGSITHTDRVAVAAVIVPGEHPVGGLGVDLETGTVTERAARVLLRPAERDRLWPRRDPATLRWLLAAKEAGFKALSEHRDDHAGLFHRVVLSRTGHRWWAHAGAHRARVVGRASDAWALALAWS